MGSKKPTVAIVMGSKTDWTTLEHTVKTLKEFNIESTVKVMSAHRTPHEATAFAENAAKNGYKVIIGAAGGAAHLLQIPTLDLLWLKTAPRVRRVSRCS